MILLPPQNSCGGGLPACRGGLPACRGLPTQKGTENLRMFRIKAPRCISSKHLSASFYTHVTLFLVHLFSPHSAHVRRDLCNDHDNSRNDAWKIRDSNSVVFVWGGSPPRGMKERTTRPNLSHNLQRHLQSQPQERPPYQQHHTAVATATATTTNRHRTSLSCGYPFRTTTFF